jgi:hypothetical protein
MRARRSGIVVFDITDIDGVVNEVVAPANATGT